MVCRTGNTVGALVNASGSFDICSITWTNGVPSAGAAIASYSNSVVIGKTSESRVEIDFNSFQLKDKNNNSYFNVQDLRNSSGIAGPFKETFLGSDKQIGQHDFFELSLIPIVSSVSVKLNGTATTDFSVEYYGSELRALVISTTIADTDRIEVSYNSESDMAKTFTFGTRKSDYNLGATSVVIGQDNAASGISSTAINQNNKATGNYSFASGYQTTASGNYAHAEGRFSTASGDNSHAEGYRTTTEGSASHAEGSLTSSGRFAHAEGYSTTASGQGAHAEGADTEATAEYSHAEGDYSKATNKRAHAEGCHTTASGQQAHAEGYYTTASGTNAHVEGYYSSASGNNSHAQNYYTIASGDNQTAIGKYNVSDTTKALIIGNGTSNTARKNALTVD